MTKAKKTTKGNILAYLREAQTMQYNSRACAVYIGFISGRFGVIRLGLFPPNGDSNTFILYQEKDKAYNDQVMADFKDKWLYYEELYLR